MRGPMGVVATDPVAEHKPHYSKELCIHKRFSAPAKALFIFQQHLIWTNSSSTRDTQLPGILCGWGGEEPLYERLVHHPQ